jgi:hypothetical protein
MNEKEIRALIKEAEAAAKRYKAQLNAKSKTSTTKATKSPSKPKKTTPRIRGGAGGSGLNINDIK